MKYAALVDVYERLEATDSTLAKRDVLGEAFADADDEHLPLVVVLCQGHLFAAWQRKELGVSSSLTARAIAKATGVSEDGIERRWEETGDLGDAAAWATENEAQRTLFSTDLTVQAVVETLRELPTYEGEGSEQRRVDAIAGLLSDATPREARYVTRTALGHLRIGIGEGLVRDAIALAFLNGIDDAGTVGDSGETTDGEATDDKTTEGEATNGKATDGEGADSEAIEAVERAFQVTNDYPLVAHTAREEGLSGLTELGIELFRPARVMLAEKAAGLDTGIGSVAENPADVLLEFKYDGARVQVHKQG
jgi:DNA ligase-1